jgi:hypothetical protein
MMLAALLGLAASSPPRVKAAAAGSFSLVVFTDFCPAEIQSVAELLAAANGCPRGVKPADYPSVPAGYTTDLVSAAFGYRLTSADGTIHPPLEFLLEGGGTCDPVTLTCSFGYGYQVDSVTRGLATLKMTTLPAGYRFGWARAYGAGALLIPSAPGADPTLDAGNQATLDTSRRVVTFNISTAKCLDHVCDVTIFLFVRAQAPAPTPTESVSNTAAADSGRAMGNLSWLLRLLAVAFVLSAAGLAFRYRRRKSRRCR